MVCKACGKKVFAKETCVCGETAPRKHGFLVALNSIICIILILFSTVNLIMTVSLRSVVNNQILIDSVNEIDLGNINLGKISGYNEEVNLDKYILDNYINDERITVDNVDSMLEEPFIKEFIISKIESTQNFLLDEGELTYITPDDIINLIENNEDKLINEVSLRFLEPDKEQLRNDLDGLAEFNNTLEKTVGTKFGTLAVQTYFSFWFVILLAVIFVVVLIQWIIVYKKNARRQGKMFRKYSISVLIPSVLIFIFSLILPLTLKISLPKEIKFVTEIVSPARIPFVICSGIMILYGIVLLLISIMLLKNKKIKGDTEQNLSDNSDNTEETNTTVPVCVAVPAQEETTVSASLDATKTDYKICPKCSHNNKITASFCSQCGTKLS